ncbi:MAG TPA: hypothetical protein DCX79_05700, partial [Planctomycetaceae bacterium]|nr:hypothetical protein [Planctomycetaceae bacterium]
MGVCWKPECLRRRVFFRKPGLHGSLFETFSISGGFRVLAPGNSPFQRINGWKCPGRAVFWDLHMSIMRVRHVLLALGFLFCGLPFSVVQAQSDEPASPLQLIQEGKRPLLTITFSGADRFMAKSKYIFEASEHSEVFGIIENFMKDSMNNLEGFNRGK